MRSGRGGARPGAGRPATGKKERITINIGQEELEWLKGQSGSYSAVVSSLIQAEMDKEGGMETYWLITPEVPEDDGTETGRYFGQQHEYYGTDVYGQDEYSEEQIGGESILFKSRTEAEQFLKKNRGGICD